MGILKRGDLGSAVELLQLGLSRAGFGEGLERDGIFGPATEQALRRFQRANSLYADGVAGQQTHQALLPWYTGFRRHQVRPGESIYTIAGRYGASGEAIITANPGLVPERLQSGTVITVPLPFSLVPTDIRYSSVLVAYIVRGLAARYPFISTGQIGKSVMGRPLWRLSLGWGENRVLYNASHHANEWICTPLLLKFAEELAEAYARRGMICGQSAEEILNYAAIHMIPALNPDGIDLVTGALRAGEYYRRALAIAADYPAIPFPSGWKANIQGIDLNLQYPAGWEQARANKYALGYISPAPADFVGVAPLSASESRAMYEYTLAFSPELILAYHTQGEVIYWRYEDSDPPGAEEIVRLFSEVSGYPAEDTPYSSAYAGYKDWFIRSFDRPGYTVEAGLGQNPLPLTQFDRIYRDNMGILTLGAIVT